MTLKKENLERQISKNKKINKKTSLVSAQKMQQKNQ